MSIIILTFVLLLSDTVNLLVRLRKQPQSPMWRGDSDTENLLFHSMPAALHSLP